MMEVELRSATVFRQPNIDAQVRFVSSFEGNRYIVQACSDARMTVLGRGKQPSRICITFLQRPPAPMRHGIGLAFTPTPDECRAFARALLAAAELAEKGASLSAVRGAA